MSRAKQTTFSSPFIYTDGAEDKVGVESVTTLKGPSHKATNLANELAKVNYA